MRSFITKFSNCADVNSELNDEIESLNMNHYNINLDDNNIIDKIKSLKNLKYLSMKSCIENFTGGVDVINDMYLVKNIATKKEIDFINEMSSKVDVIFMDSSFVGLTTLNGLKIDKHLDILFIDIQNYIAEFDLYIFKDSELTDFQQKLIRNFIGDFKIHRSTTIIGIPDFILKQIPYI